MFAWAKPARPVPPELIFEIRGARRRGWPGDRAARRGRRARGGASAARGRGRLRGRSSSCTATPTRPRAPRARRRCLPSTPTARSRCRARCCRCSASSSARWSRSSTPTCSRIVGRYVGRLAERLGERGIAAPLAIMKSNGGVVRAPASRAQAIHTALSGPAAGVIGARLIGEAAGFADVISVDVGGTSADVCLIQGGEAAVTVEGRVGGLAGAGADDRHPHDRRGRRHHRPRHRRRHADGGPGERRRCARARVLRRRRRGADRHRRAPRARPHSRAPPGRRDRRSTSSARGGPSRSAWRGRSACRSRPRRAASSTSSTTTWSAPSAWCRSSAATIRASSRSCRSAGRVRCTAPSWRRCSACARWWCRGTPACSRRSGCSAPRCATTTRGRACRSRRTTTGRRSPRRLRGPRAPGRAVARRRGRAARAAPALSRLADLRYRHQGFEITVPWPEPGPARSSALLARFHARHERLYTYALPEAPVEIVTLRLVAPGPRAALRAPPSGARPAPPATDDAPGLLPRATAGSRVPASTARRWGPAPSSPARPSSSSRTPPPSCCRASARAPIGSATVVTGTAGR